MRYARATVPWQIASEPPEIISETDKERWIWTIERDGVRRLVTVFVVRTALSVDNADDETAEAIRTQGKSEVERVLAMDDPPGVIGCDTRGCRPAGD